MDYFRASTWSGWALFAVGMTLGQGFLVLSNIWLKVWSSANDTRMRDGAPESHSVLYFIAIYGMLGLISAVFTFSQSMVLWSMCAVRCGRATHRNMLAAVLRSPMSFFDTTPLGRVLQRFSNDQTSVDEVIPRTFGSWFQNLVSIVLSLAVIMYFMPAFGLMIIPTILFF
ncbi:hypothetical protein GGI06_001418 [Coemansia sp. S85]|nr:hypothetical protein GGI06_001418 [Coemansia sp. S85]